MTEIGAVEGQATMSEQQTPLETAQEPLAQTAQPEQSHQAVAEVPNDASNTDNQNDVKLKQQDAPKTEDEPMDTSEDVKMEDEPQKDSAEPETAAPAATPAPKRRRPAKKAKKPSKILKLKIENKEPAPEFVPINNEGTPECFWLRVLVREFILRFDRICRFSARNLGALNDLARSWPDTLYKAVLVSLLRIFSLDRSWLIPQVKHLLPQIEGCQADSSHLWTLVGDFLYEQDPYSHMAEQLTGEHYRLELIRRVLVLTTSTDAVRNCIAEDQEKCLQFRKNCTDTVKQIQTQHVANLEKMKKENKQVVYNEKKKVADKAAMDKVFKEEQTLYSRLRKLSLRTSAVGSDNYGNNYWILQQKGKDNWGCTILCELKVLPEDEDHMIIEQKEPELDENGKPKKVRRKYIIPKKDYLCEGKPTLYIASGQQNIQVLAGWIRGQVGKKNEELAINIESLAYYFPE